MIPARIPHQINMLKEDSIAEGIKPELRANYTTKIEEGITAWQSALQQAQGSVRLILTED